MKTFKLITTAIVLFIATTPSHAEKITAGPKGGRLLKIEKTQAEFFIEKDRTANVTFYDSNLKAMPPGTQSVTAIAETKDGKKKISFEKKGDVMVSNEALPPGNGYTVVLQIQISPEAKVRNFRIPINTELCSECQHAEYACVCEGH